MNHLPQAIAPALFVAVCASIVAHADDGAAAGREVLAKHQAAVVTVKLVIKQGMGFGAMDRKSESKSEATGVVVDPAGLTVISMSAIDPSSTYSQFFKGGMEGFGGNVQFQFTSELVSVKILRPDETEVTAEVVLRDKDHDLAYLRPVEPVSPPFTAVDLSQDPRPALLDEVIILGRLGKAINRAATVSLGRIEAIVEKPRLCFVLGNTSWSNGLGSPVFTRDGKLIGVILLRTGPSEGGIGLGSMFSGMSNLGMLPVVVSTKEILAGAKQAKEVQKPLAEKTEADRPRGGDWISVPTGVFEIASPLRGED